jgi:drug/metabolite transporter (DMT)-like permease
LFQSELVIAAISSYFLANEVMGMRDWIGAALIMAASFLSGKLCSDENVGYSTQL